MIKNSNRFSTAMWDFSWATRRFGNEAEYASWPKVLDELAERGYDSVRIDAFPYLIGHGKAVILPQRKHFMWGNHSKVEICPDDDLIQFVQLCAERNIKVGISSWFIPDAENRHLTIATPADFANIWNQTLTLLDTHDLLGEILWVDLCNEFPLDIWAPGATKEIFGRTYSTPLGVGTRSLPWSQTQLDRTQRYFDEAISELKQKWPNLEFCFSFSEVTGSSLRRLDVGAFDLGEIHCWLTDDILWSVSSLQMLALLEVPVGSRWHALSTMNYSQSKLLKLVDRVLEPQMQKWANWAGKHNLPLVTTEGWGPVNYKDQSRLEGEWNWVKNFSELAVDKAITKGWKGICSSNFCQPHHKGMWQDLNWHKQITEAIRNE